MDGSSTNVSLFSFFLYFLIRDLSREDHYLLIRILHFSSLIVINRVLFVSCLAEKYGVLSNTVSFQIRVDV